MSMIRKFGYHTRLSVGLTGWLLQSRWHKVGQKVDFYTMKGLIYSMLNELGYADSRILVKPIQQECILHPYQSAELFLDKKSIGMFGMLHPTIVEQFDLHSTAVCELDLTEVLACTPAKLRFTPIPKFPTSTYDLSSIVQEDVTADSIVQICKKHGTNLLKNVEVLDIYQGKGIYDGHKSVTVRLSFRSDEKTLKDEDIRSVVNTIIEKLREGVNAEIREA